MKMKHRAALFLTFLAFVVSAASQAANVPGHDHHDHGSDAPQKLHLNAGKKWETDEHLRNAMSEINKTMTEAISRIRKSQFSDGDYAMLAATVNQKVAYAVEHCKLAPKADAVLHLVIADISSGTEAMEGKSQHTSRHDGAVRVIKALSAYGKHFQHPDWKPVRI